VCAAASAPCRCRPRAALHNAPMGDERGEGAALQRQIDELSARMTTNESDVKALAVRADATNGRADQLESRADIDREMISDLQSEGLLSREHAEHLDQALRSSRTIGAAMGLIMASRHVDEDEAFAILKAASQNSNRKLREIAAELVASGGLTDPPPAVDVHTAGGSAATLSEAAEPGKSRFPGRSPN
jgi:hypothetical protein